MERERINSKKEIFNHKLKLGGIFFVIINWPYFEKKIQLIGFS